MSSKKLTPEEILEEHREDDYSLDGELAINTAIRAMKQYAAQEVEAAKRSMWDEGGNVVLSTLMYTGMTAELREKDALLKEAIGLIRHLKAMCSANYSPIHEEIETFINKATGSGSLNSK